MEWPDGESEPANYFFSSLPEKTKRIHLVRTTMQRWRTERVYEDLKGELGLDHFEGRRFRGWHHHISVVLCCYAFAVAERHRIFPLRTQTGGARPRDTHGSQARTPLRELAHQRAPSHRTRKSAVASEMPLLPSARTDQTKGSTQDLVSSR